MTKCEAIKWLKDMLKNFDLPQEQYQTALEVGNQSTQTVRSVAGDTAGDIKIALTSEYRWRDWDL